MFPPVTPEVATAPESSLETEEEAKAGLEPRGEPRMKIPIFSGEEGEDVEGWARHIDRMESLLNWGSHTKAIKICSALEGTAMKWLDTVPQ